MPQHTTQRTQWLVLCGCLLLTALIFASTTVYFWQQLSAERTNHNQAQFTLLSPTVAWLSVDEFVAKQQVLSASLSDLRAPIHTVMNGSNLTGTYGIYVEDLTTGAWMGINERDEFVPASLLKIPLMVAVLKNVETGQISLEQNVTLTQDDINYQFGPLAYFGPGYTLTVRELLTDLIVYSDNTAADALKREFVPDDEYIATAVALGLPPPTPEFGVSPKQYSNSLRALYFSTQLRRPLSEAAISILLKSKFNTQLPAKLPSTIPVAHKIGVAYNDESKQLGSYHDCGIVYLPSKPYMICIMSKDASEAEANAIISEISYTVFLYMNQTIA